MRKTPGISRTKFTANYGLRLDAYEQTETENLGSSPAVNQSNVSPRVNLAYKLAQGTVARASYDRLFTEPPLAQGSILGQPIMPQIADQYEVGLERQLTPRQVAKVSYYTKTDTNQIDTGLLIPGTQIGALSAINFQHGHIRGLEVSYNLLPARDNHGWNAFLCYTNSLAKPSGLDNTGMPAPTYNDHDQLHTVTTGAAYAWRSGVTAATDIYYGSGTTNSDIFGTGQRTPNSQVNASLSLAPKVFGPKNPFGVEFAVENVFDSRTLLNFDSGFDGTRFQQARSFIMSANAHF